MKKLFLILSLIASTANAVVEPAPVEVYSNGNANSVSNPLYITGEIDVPAPVGGSTEAKQDTMIGHIDQLEGYLDGVEGNQTTGNGHLSNLLTKLTSIDDKTASLPRSASGSIVFGGNMTVELDLTTVGGKINSIGVEATGTYGGEVAIETSVDGTTFIQAEGIEETQNGQTNNKSPYLSSPGHMRRIVSAAGLKKIRVNGTGGIASGTANITLTASSASINYYTLPSATTAIEDDRTSAGFVEDGGNPFEITGVDQFLTIACNERGMADIYITGTFVGTLSFVTNFVSGGELVEVGSDYPMPVYPFPASAGNAPVTSTTAPGRWEFPCGGKYGVDVRATAWTSGTARVYTNVSVAPRVLLADVFRLPSTAATTTKQDTIIGHVDGLETLITSTNTKLDSQITQATSTNTKLDTVIGHVDGLEGFVDGIETLLTSISGFVDQLEGYLDQVEAKLDSLIAKDFATSAKQDTIIGHLDGVEGSLTSIASSNSSMDTKTVASRSANPIYQYTLPSQVHVAGANTVHFDMFNADATKVIRVLSIKQIPNITTAVTGVVFDWLLERTTAVGTGGSTLTAWQSDTSATALDADVTARSKPTGGATQSTDLFNYSLSSEETNASTIEVASIGGLELIPEANRIINNGHGIVLRQNQGLRIVQVTNSNAGNTGWLISFTME